MIIIHLASGVGGWVIGVWLARRRFHRDGNQIAFGGVLRDGFVGYWKLRSEYGADIGVPG
ncbi:MAG: hypothetical protein KDE47_23610 [Caldilineaceae bacterium]|nr:hypothetical protein [Caldilineaceae bacterium]